MDDPAFEGDELSESFGFIRLVNLLGGGRRAVLRGMGAALGRSRPGRRIEVLDVGCGVGDLGPPIVRWGRFRGLDMRYTGIDRSGPTLELARRSASADPRIRFIEGDLFGESVPEADVVVASMVLHHLDDREAVRAIRHLSGRARIALVVNDLERCLPAWIAAWLLTRFLKSPRSRSDALLSVQKGFTATELGSLLAASGRTAAVRPALGWRLVGTVLTAVR